MERIELAGGRTLEYLVEGPAGALPLVLHHGTPGGAVRQAPIFDAVTGRGLRILQYSRPGYGGSSPHPGRLVADAAADVVALLDTIGADEFVTAGWSGGGPHALACAALLPGRCLAAATIAGVAPYAAEGLDWLAGMGDENLAEFGAAAAGPAALTTYLSAEAEGMAEVQPADIVAAFGDLLSEVDKRALTADFADYLASSCRHAVAAGIAGWRDDDLAFVSGWGFPLDGPSSPVAIWQGDQDRMVPPTHGEWLAAHIPGASAHLRPGEGHLSLINDFTTVLDDLLKHT